MCVTGGNGSMRISRGGSAVVAAIALGAVAALAALGAPPSNVRLTNDAAGGYVSADSLAGLGAYTDATLGECSRAHGRQNEPAVAIDPRNPAVMVGSSNDYCGLYNDGVADT